MMKENKHTPACILIDKFGDRWSLNILMLLHQNEVMRFSELQKKIPTISQRMLAITLKTLESLSLIHRKAYPEVPPRVEYSLTDLAKELIPIVQTLLNWANQHAEELTKKWEK
ncbi:MAG: helix-turn-helix transcriptional regulator [Tannerellaceae bacterium]|nr:helix-turn-helix transcriptional regulator [Tannerellaceae bacterium]